MQLPLVDLADPPFESMIRLNSLAAVFEAAYHLQSHMRGASAPGNRLPSSHKSRQLPLGLDGADDFIDLRATILNG